MTNAAYLRVSSDKQTALRQREALKHLPIDRWYEDSEGSNPRDKAETRKAFQRLLRDVERGLVETIYVAALDRFGTKDAYELGHFFTLLRKHDCRLLDATGKVLNADDDATVITSTIGALTSTREQKEKANRILTGKITKFKAGATYQGGHPPYGFDVACLGPDGKEKWRVVYEGHNRRRKVYPDGRTERFDGKRNHPPKELNDVLRLRPSIEAERVKYAKLIFRWFATETIAPGQIAARLNDLGISPIFGPVWHRSAVRYILSNPAYIGYPTWNRAGNSRFMEYSGGHVQSVNGQKHVRKRTPSDWLRAEKPEYRPLIDQETWDKVQAKAAALHEKYRAPTTAPRTAELWLRGLVVCGWCGKPMRAYVGSKQNSQPPGYSCAGYMQHGKRNPHGCKQHHVPHDLLERLILDYLTTTAPEVKTLLDAAEADNLEAARPLLDAIESARQELGGVWCEMVAFVADYFRGNKARRKAERKLTIEELYSASYRHVRPQIEKTIAAKEAELESLLDSFAGLSPKLKERANRRGEALQEEIDALKRDLGNLRITWDRIKEDLRQRKAALDQAVSALNEEGRHRQKAEAVRTVVDRIVCHFQPHGKRHKLSSIEIAASEDGAIRPRTFPELTLQSDARSFALS